MKIHKANPGFEIDRCPTCGLDKNRLKNWEKLWVSKNFWRKTNIVNDSSVMREKAEAHDSNTKLSNAIILVMLGILVAMQIFGR